MNSEHKYDHNQSVTVTASFVCYKCKYGEPTFCENLPTCKHEIVIELGNASSKSKDVDPPVCYRCKYGEPTSCEKLPTCKRTLAFTLQEVREWAANGNIKLNARFAK